MFGLILAAVLAATPTTTPAPDYSPISMEAGNWTADITFFDPATGKVAGHAKGTQKNVMLINKHWVTNDFDVPSDGKNPEFQGHGVWGYDPVAQTFVDTWVDIHDGAVRTDYGYWDALQKTMYWAAKQSDGQGNFVDWRLVEKFQGDTRILEFYQVAMESGRPLLLASMKFTRV
jgi:hypothetical protein